MRRHFVTSFRNIDTGNLLLPERLLNVAPYGLDAGKHDIALAFRKWSVMDSFKTRCILCDNVSNHVGMGRYPKLNISRNVKRTIPIDAFQVPDMLQMEGTGMDKIWANTVRTCLIRFGPSGTICPKYVENVAALSACLVERATDSAR